MSDVRASSKAIPRKHERTTPTDQREYDPKPENIKRRVFEVSKSRLYQNLQKQTY